VTEPFSRAKVADGVRKACSGRPVTEDALALLAQQVEEAVRSSGCAEVPAHEVGLAILAPLRDLDEVAYMRFASVYRSFSSLGDFEAEIAELRAHQSVGYPAPGLLGTQHEASQVLRYGGAHDPAPPPVQAVPATS
jgi:transcriptional repressor NrdR